MDARPKLHAIIAQNMCVGHERVQGLQREHKQSCHDDSQLHTAPDGLQMELVL